MVTLSTEKINEIGKYISEFLHKCGVKESELSIYVDNESFKKIDEDLFYKLNDNEENKFVPSENEISVLFNNFKLLIKERKT